MKIIVELDNYKLLGKGAEGSVYLSKEGYAIKIFNKIKNADDEGMILKKTHNSRFFPKLIIQLGNILIRECVYGNNLYEYITSNNLSKKLAFEIIEFIEEIKMLNFSRVNIRNAHIFIDNNEKLMVIDPRKPFTKITPYPKDIIKILLKTQCYDKFLEYVAQYDHSLLSYWIKGYEYVAENNRISRYDGVKNLNRYRVKAKRKNKL